ncbi:MAG TPA: L,D-transpeptidase, partial [Myxococcota bacterium]|nr:L,D-transpeptidase [Myxococcota bacterium]
MGPPAPELRRTLSALNVRRTPDVKAALRGQILSGALVRVWEQVEGPGCSAGWGKIDEDAYVCLSATEVRGLPSAELPVAPPVPASEEALPVAPLVVPDENAVLPYLYGRPGRRGPAPLYASAEAWAAGAEKVGELEADRAMLFVGTQATSKGDVLVRRDGTVVPAAEVVLYPIDRFQGRDFTREALPEDRLPAWATASRGTPVYSAPSTEAEVGATLPARTPLLLAGSPVDADGRWWSVPDGLGPGRPGYVEDSGGLRHATRLAPPAEVSSALWVDVDLSEQVLMLWENDQLRYATLVSTGKPGHSTPTGIFRIADKAATRDMASLPDAKEAYFVEGVPWVMHFAPRYALHGAFWHSSFGRVRSHGCVNLAPLDAHWVFDQLEPTLVEGWSVVYESPAHPGTTVRIRNGAQP